MAATYDPTLSTPKDQTRLMLGDTGPTSWLFQDEEINAMITLYGSAGNAAVALAESLAAKFSSAVDIVVDGLSVSNSQKAAAYLALSQRLRSAGFLGADGAIGVPIVTGVSIVEMASVSSDSDRPRDYEKGMFDNPPHNRGTPDALLDQ